MSLSAIRTECEQLERRARWEQANHRWMELARLHANREQWAEAENAARHACVCAERLADEHGRRVPAVNQRRGEA